MKVIFNPLAAEFQLAQDQASEISIADAGKYYQSDTVEGALQEIGNARSTRPAYISAGLSDAPSDGNTYGRNNGTWTTITAGGGTWGTITGTLFDQTDLQTALDAKEPAITILASTRGGTGVNNAGTLTLGATNTSIVGNGFTLTVPASLTVAGLAVQNVFTVLNNFKSAVGIRIEGTGTNTNIMDLVPGTASSYDRLDFIAVNTNRGSSFNLVPNGTSARSKISMFNQSSQTNFGSLFLEAADISGVMYGIIGTQTSGTGTSIDRLRLGSGTGGVDWTYIHIPTARIMLGTTFASTIRFFIENTTDLFGLVINTPAGQTRDYVLLRDSASNTMASISANGVGLFSPRTTTTNAVIEAMKLQAVVSTAATGGTTNFGSGLSFAAETATDGTQQLMAMFGGQFATATNASFKGRAVIGVYDFNVPAFANYREVFRGESNGTAAMIGFFGSNAVVRQVLAAYTSDGEGGAYTGIDNLQAGTVYATVADLNQLRVAYETLRASYDDLRTKLITSTLVA